jgi:hypothetical protein
MRWPGMSLSGLPVVLQHQRMETVERDAQVGLVGALDDVPDLAPGFHGAAPGQRLEGDPDFAPRRPLRQQGHLLGAQLEVARRRFGNVRAYQDQLGAEFLHHVELALRPVQVALQLFGTDALEVAERLEHVDAQAEVQADAAHVGRRTGKLQQIVLEDFNAVETGGGGGFQLLGQHARERHGGDGLAHVLLLQFMPCGPGRPPRRRAGAVPGCAAKPGR